MTWLHRARTLRAELAAIAPGDPRWWLLAGAAAAAEPLRARDAYVVSDGGPAADTFIGRVSDAPRDPLRDAIARARSARAALRALDGRLPEQPLAVTLDRGALRPSELDVAAFAIGPRVVTARLDDPSLLAQLAAAAGGSVAPAWHGAAPFVCASIGDDPLAVARHGHRRAWRDGAGPWLGLGRAGELSTVSTCHLAVDGYGHAWLASLIEGDPYGAVLDLAIPPLAPVADAVPLGVAWRELPQGAPAPRALPLAYELGLALARASGRSRAFSPTFQIPVAPGRREDPARRLRRVLPALASVRFDGDVPEPYAAFAARTRDALAREADGTGLCARLVAAARATPAPLAWKRKQFGAERPRWLDGMSEVLGGRACLSRMRLDFSSPPSCAVSSPSRLASVTDPLGACVITVMDDGEAASITACGSGLAGTAARAEALLDELLAGLASAGR